MAHWQTPVAEPFLTNAWVEALASRDREKATAKGTRFRFSAALDCSRKSVLTAMGIAPSDPMDLAGLMTTAAGERMHLEFQEAYAQQHPYAKFEVPAQVGLTSGSADIVDGPRVIEIKNVGGFPFDKAVGVNRKAYARVKPEGPRFSAIAQAGLNALANDCTEVYVVYLARDPISKQCAQRVGFSEQERVCAEWKIPEQVWRPLAVSEVNRVAMLDQDVDKGYIPPGDMYDEEKGVFMPISPLPPSKRPWVCHYCSQLANCTTYEELGELP